MSASPLPYFPDSQVPREMTRDDMDLVRDQFVASTRQQPAYGRTYQTPYADRIRHEAGIPTIAVGAISSYDDVNTIVLSGRADLCAVARPQLYDPYWTLHAAADQEFRGDPWIVQYRAGRRRPNDGRVDVRRAPPRSFDPPTPTPSGRWRPGANVLLVA